MKPYNEITSRPIAAYNVYTFGTQPKESFFRMFQTDDVKSFEFLYALIEYCCRFNQGMWPDILDEKVLKVMGKTIEDIESLQLYAEGYIQNYKPSRSLHVLTHEFVVFAYMACPGGDYIPLGAGHIDFKKEDVITAFMQEHMGVLEPQAALFFTKLAARIGKEAGPLLNRDWSMDLIFEVTREHNLVPDLCVQWAEALNFISFDAESRTMVCNALILIVYAASPKL